MSTKKILFLFLILFLPIFSQHQHNVNEKKVKIEKRIKFWTCSMHPQIKLPNPGKCPICSMDLIPVYEEEAEEKPVLKLTDLQRKVAEIETSTVSYRDLKFQIKLLGKVEYDETRIKNISAYVYGRIDKLYVNFVGAYIKEKTPLYQFYSPEILTTQNEYLIALRRYKDAIIKNEKEEILLSKKILEGVKKKMELWGILPEQIEEIEKRNFPSDRIDIYSPLSGIIIERNAYEGKYFNAGDILFKIADLSSVWIKLDVYEKDLQYVKLGQELNFVTESYPSEVFKGEITFIDPFLNENTRSVKVRMEVKNEDIKLKPGMFGHAILDVFLGKKLSIPASAVLLTGKRAIVYVEVKKNVFEGREVIIGQKAGNFYPVISGLKEGEKVVTKGNFVIDASLQIQAKPSMMKPKEKMEEIKVAPEIHRH